MNWPYNTLHPCHLSGFRKTAGGSKRLVLEGI